MALAETQAALGDTDAAIATWQRVLENNSYSRARFQLAELYARNGQHAAARALLQELISDDAHSPAFQRKREKVWTSRAKKLLGSLPAKVS